MIFTQYPIFFRKSVVRTWPRFKNPVITRTEDLILPRTSVIHYVSNSITNYGIENTHGLMQNVGPRINVYHQLTMDNNYGTSKKRSVQPTALIRSYQRRYKQFRWARELDVIFKNDRVHSCINYALLPHLYRYFQNQMSVYNEYMDTRAEVWKMVEQIGLESFPNIETAVESKNVVLPELTSLYGYFDEISVEHMGEIITDFDELVALEASSKTIGRYQFIPVYLPKILPSRPTFDRFVDKMTIQGMNQFGSQEGLDLLDIWKIVHPDAEHPAKTMNPKILELVHLAFIESGQVSVVKLGDLVNWAKEYPNDIRRNLHKFFDRTMMLRTVVVPPITTDEDGSKETTLPELLNESEADELLEINVDEAEETEDGEVEEDEITSTVVEEDLSEEADSTFGGDDEEFNTPKEDAESAALNVVLTSPMKDFGKKKIKSLIDERGALGLLSTAEQKALTKMSSKYEELPFVKEILGDDTLNITTKDISLPNATIATTGAVNDIEPGLESSAVEAYREGYLDKLHQKLILNMLVSIQAGGVIVKDIKVKKKRTAVTHSDTYTLNVVPVGGTPTSLVLTIPDIKDNGTFISGGSRYRLDPQKGDYPIWKIKPTTVSLTSYAGKQFVIRNQNSASNYEKWIIKFITNRALSSDDISVTELVNGQNKLTGAKLPRSYSAIAKSVNQFTSGRYLFIFNHDQLSKHFTETIIKFANSQDMVPCGFVKDDKSPGVMLMDMYGVIWQLTSTGKLDDKPLGKIQHLIDPTSGNGPQEYCELGIYSKRIPVILALCYLMGLDKALKRLKIPFTTIPTGSRVALEEDQYRLNFKDESYLISTVTLEHRLMISGFNSIRKRVKRYTSNDLNKRSSYASLLSHAGIGQAHLRELVLMNDMFIDPLTLKLLEMLKEPTDYIGLLVKSNSLLVDDYVNPVEPARLRGYERIPGFIYNQLVNSIRGYRSRGNNPDAAVNINPSAVWLDILSDPSTTVVEDSNPIHSIKERSVVTAVGQGGRKAESMTKEARGFSESDIGVFGESNPDSGKAGIRNFMTANPRIENLLGFLKEPDGKEDPANLLTISALRAPGSMHDDKYMCPLRE